jgi:hypothetical protein
LTSAISSISLCYGFLPVTTCLPLEYSFGVFYPLLPLKNTMNISVISNYCWDVLIDLLACFWGLDPSYLSLTWSYLLNIWFYSSLQEVINKNLLVIFLCTDYFTEPFPPWIIYTWILIFIFIVVVTAILLRRDMKRKFCPPEEEKEKLE